MKCRRVRHLLFDFVDGLGNEALHAEVDRHLAECVDCEKFAAETTRSLALLRRTPVEPLDENFNWKVRLAIHREQKAGGRSTASAGAWANAWNFRYAASTGIAFAAVLVAGVATLHSLRSAPEGDRAIQPAPSASHVEVAKPRIDFKSTRPTVVERVGTGSQMSRGDAARPVGRGAIDPYAAEVAIDSLIDARLVTMTPEKRMRCIQRQIHRLQSQLESQRAPVAQP